MEGNVTYPGVVDRKLQKTARRSQSCAHQTSQSQPNLMSSSSTVGISRCTSRAAREQKICRGAYLRTFEFIFADVDRGGWRGEVGGEIIDHGDSGRQQLCNWVILHNWSCCGVKSKYWSIDFNSERCRHDPPYSFSVSVLGMSLGVSGI